MKGEQSKRLINGFINRSIDEAVGVETGGGGKRRKWEIRGEKNRK